MISKEGLVKRGEFDPTGAKPKRAEFSKDVLKVERAKNNNLKKYSGKTLKLMLEAGFSEKEARRVIFDKTNPYVNELLAYVRDMPGNNVTLDPMREMTGRLAFVKNEVATVDGPKHVDIALNWAEFIYPKIKKATKGFDFERIVKPAILGQAPVLYDAVWRIYMSPLEELDSDMVKKIHDELMKIVELSRQFGSVELAVTEIVRRREEEKRRKEEMAKRLREELERKLEEKKDAEERKKLEREAELEARKCEEEEATLEAAEDSVTEDEDYGDEDEGAGVEALSDTIGGQMQNLAAIQKTVMDMNSEEYAEIKNDYEQRLGEAARIDPWLRVIHGSAVQQLHSIEKEIIAAKSDEEILSIMKSINESPTYQALSLHVNRGGDSSKDYSAVKAYAHFYMTLLLITASRYVKRG